MKIKNREAHIPLASNFLHEFILGEEYGVLVLIGDDIVISLLIHYLNARFFIFWE